MRTYPLQDKSRRACPELVERGRLNLAQDAVLGDSIDEESRRDDWKVTRMRSQSTRCRTMPSPRIPDSLPEFRTKSRITFSAPPYGPRFHNDRSRADSFSAFSSFSALFFEMRRQGSFTALRRLSSHSSLSTHVFPTEHPRTRPLWRIRRLRRTLPPSRPTRQLSR